MDLDPLKRTTEILDRPLGVAKATIVSGDIIFLMWRKPLEQTFAGLLLIH